MSSQTSTDAAVDGPDPRPAAVTFVTTEHFTLQGARAATIAESTGRATMFLGSVSAGLVALGLIAAATRIGATFYAFGVVVLATLSFVGVVTFERVLQSGLEDHGYAQRIARPVDSAIVAARAPCKVKCSVVTNVTAAGRGSAPPAAALVLVWLLIARRLPSVSAAAGRARPQ